MAEVLLIVDAEYRKRRILRNLETLDMSIEVGNLHQPGNEALVGSDTVGIILSAMLLEGYPNKVVGILTKAASANIPVVVASELPLGEDKNIWPIKVAVKAGIKFRVCEQGEEVSSLKNLLANS